MQQQPPQIQRKTRARAVEQPTCYGVDARGQIIPYRRTQPVTQKEIHVQEQRDTEQPLQIEVKQSTQQNAPHPFTVTGLIMGGAVVAYGAWSLLINPIIVGTYNQWHYGDARVSTAQVVNNGKTENVLATCQHGQIAAIVFPPDTDTTHPPQVYVSSQTLSDGSTHAVSISFQDVNGDGKQDIVLRVQDTSTMLVLFNQGNGTYSWNAPGGKE